MVRGYLDFDVAMEKILTKWKIPELLITEYNLKQEKLRSKQKMLKEDWEKFKAQRREFERQMLSNSDGDR